ncbi:alpha/beta hydrolase [Streptomonospora sp. S1-112]|uniref:Alpha/beta hydrolase n=1 Tax=Streptomonospora mangrovi TaxID=2883123 RepID=A0A9X3NWY5_9ACTN|nr:alpha/beta hydrolase [Streptomonospora mangrovi]MDA0565836.1 alpha/beta hydrolase [Streptomonospora mangrovi]
MHTVISRDGTPIAYDKTGTGPALVLVSGALMARADFAPYTALLSEHFTVYAHDRRGRGDSGDTAPYDVAREVEDIDAVIEAAGGSAMLLGLSSGAVLALEAAARGSAVTRVALYEPPLIVNASRPPLPADYVEHLDRLVDKGARGEAVAYFLTAAVGLPEEMVAGMRQAPMWPAMEALAHTIAYDGRVMGEAMSGNELPLHRWESVRIPVFVGIGGASEAFMQNGCRALTALGPHVVTHTFPGQDHGIAPEALAPVVTEFFTAEQPTATA